MAIAFISTVLCVQPATGTDIGVNEAIAGIPDEVFPHEIVGDSALAFLKSLPNIIAAIDAARADPDDLYITVGSARGRDNAIWPGPGQDIETGADQSHAVNFSVEFTSSVNVSLWDHDVSSDDLLGAVTIFENEDPGEHIKVAKSNVEGSCYYVIYTVE